MLLGPALTGALARAIRPLLIRLRPVEGALAADSLVQAPRRTSTTVLALMLSLALVIAFAGMARASYDSIVDWMNTTLNPDLFVMPSPRLDLRTTRFPASMAAEIGTVPGVHRVQMFRNGRIVIRGLPVMAVALEMESVARTARTRPVAGRSPDMYEIAAAGKGLVVSDSLSQRLHAGLGDVLEVPAPYGMVRLPIVGVIVDYTDQQGAVFMDRSVFVSHWHDDSVSDFRVFIAPGARISDVRQRILDRYAGIRQVFVLTSDESRQYVPGPDRSVVPVDERPGGGRRVRGHPGDRQHDDGVDHRPAARTGRRPGGGRSSGPGSTNDLDGGAGRGGHRTRARVARWGREPLLHARDRSARCRRPQARRTGSR